MLQITVTINQCDKCYQLLWVQFVQSECLISNSCCQDLSYRVKDNVTLYSLEYIAFPSHVTRFCMIQCSTPFVI